MRAVALERGGLGVVGVPEPEPAAGQLLVQVDRCGICGSDLHARHSQDDLAAVLELCGYDRYMRSAERVVMGHEILGTVIDKGPWASDGRGKIPIGTSVVTIPLVRRGRTVDGIGLSAHAPGGYAERVVVQEAMTIPVPNGLDADTAAVTEPMAVAWHAVNRGEIGKKDPAVVIGCGPVGLAVIAVLRMRGVRTIVASDPSPGRRALAATCGATAVVDPGAGSPFAAASGHGEYAGMTDQYNAGIDALEGLAKLPVPWWTTFRLLDAVGATAAKRPVVFECVGLPGMIDGILAEAPLETRMVVVGVCMGADRMRPALAINKEIDLRFVVGYSPLEFRDTLHALANGKLDASPLITGRVGLDGVANAFDVLAGAEHHAKILIDPRQTGTAITDVPSR